MVLLSLEEAGDEVSVNTDLACKLLLVSGLDRVRRRMQFERRQTLSQTCKTVVDDVVERINRLGSVRVQAEKFGQPWDLADLESLIRVKRQHCLHNS